MKYFTFFLIYGKSAYNINKIAGILIYPRNTGISGKFTGDTFPAKETVCRKKRIALSIIITIKSVRKIKKMIVVIKRDENRSSNSGTKTTEVIRENKGTLPNIAH